MKQESRTAGIIAGLLLATLGALIALSTSQMRIAPNYAKMGPQIFPYVAAIALGFVGLCFLIQAFRSGTDKLAADTDDTDWKALGLIAVGFVFEILFIKWLGFILASSVLFVTVSLGFGSRRYVRDIIIALVMTTIAYFTFTKLLNLQLPAGLLGGLF